MFGRPRDSAAGWNRSIVDMVKIQRYTVCKLAIVNVKGLLSKPLLFRIEPNHQLPECLQFRSIARQQASLGVTSLFRILRFQKRTPGVQSVAQALVTSTIHFNIYRLIAILSSYFNFLLFRTIESSKTHEILFLNMLRSEREQC